MKYCKKVLLVVVLVSFPLITAPSFLLERVYICERSSPGPIINHCKIMYIGKRYG